jgi:hypothetical protein
LEREAIVAAFNSPANRHGAVIRAILVSKTGAEGLDLKWVRETICAESYWDQARLDQVAARGARMGSHDGLPEAEREVRQVVFLATPNPRIWGHTPAAAREARSIDEEFYARALERAELNAAFRRLLVTVCLECQAFGYGGCRACLPTGAPLFHADPARDARLADPCEAPRAETVEARPLALPPGGPGAPEGGAFFFVPAPETVAGFRFFEARPDLGAYAPLPPADPRLDALIAAAEEASAAPAPP